MRNLFSAVLVAAAFLGLAGTSSGCSAAANAGPAIDLWSASPSGHPRPVRRARSAQRAKTGAAKADGATQRNVAAAARPATKAPQSKRIVRKRLRKAPPEPDYIPVDSRYGTSVV